MPFTPTHIVAILPFAFCRWLPFSALVIGCMIPDLPLFSSRIYYAQTHSVLGVVTVCMPLGLVVFMLFQCVLKVPLIALLPTGMQKRMTAYSNPVLKPSYWFFLGVAVALVMGGYSHIVWDAFTHQGRWGTRWIPALNHEIEIARQHLPGYKLFQYGSTVIGLPFMLFLWVRQLVRTQPREVAESLRLSPTAKAFGWASILFIPSLVALEKLSVEPTLHLKLYHAVTASGATLLVLVVVYALLFHSLSGRSLKRSSGVVRRGRRR